MWDLWSDSMSKSLHHCKAILLYGKGAGSLTKDVASSTAMTEHGVASVYKFNIL
jgi:hypothetical protein